MAININNEADLFNLMSSANPGPGGAWPLSGSYILNANLNMSSYTSKSIGGTTSPAGNGFTGSFDGQNYTIIITNTDNISGYSGFFWMVNSDNFIKNLTVKFQKPGGDIFGGVGGPSGQAGGLAAIIAGNNNDCIVDNCHIVFGDNYSLGTSSSPLAIHNGGFIGTVSDPTPTPAPFQAAVNNCSLICGDNFKIYSSQFTGFFIGFASGGSLFNCNITIGNNSYISGGDTAGIVGVTSNTNQCSLTVGDNCQIIGLGNASAISAEILDGSTIQNCKVIFLGNTTISGSSQGVGAVGGNQDYNINNCIVLFGQNTYLIGNGVATSVGGVFGTLSSPIPATNCFSIYKDYSITGPIVGPIVRSTASPLQASVLSQSCGSPLAGSQVGNISTTSLQAIIGYLQIIPYLATLIPYIEQTYCILQPMAPICPCTAYLCNSNPQTTNYDESQDTSRVSDQTVHSNIDVKLAEMWAGNRVQGVPIFKSYDEMMQYKQGQCKYRR